MPKLLVAVTPRLEEGMSTSWWLGIVASIGALLAWMGWMMAKRRFTGHFVV